MQRSPKASGHSAEFSTNHNTAPDWRKRLPLRSIGATASLLGTVLMSAGATMEANSPRDRGLTPEVATTTVVDTTNAEVTAGVGAADVLPGDGAIPLPAARLDAAQTHDVLQDGDGQWVSSPDLLTREQKIQDMEWARLFSQDPRVGETLDQGKQIEATARMIEQLRAAGYNIDEIILHGYASDEDDTTTTTGVPGAGLGVDSDKNVKLAEKRAAVVGELLSDRLDQNLRNKLTVTGGTEVRDDALNQAIEQLAQQRGDSVQTVVTEYNEGTGSFSSAERAVLDQLAAGRYVSIEVKAHKPGMVWREGGLRPAEEKGESISLVLVPILIPLGKRKRETDSKQHDDAGPTPSVRDRSEGLADDAIEGAPVWRDGDPLPTVVLPPELTPTVVPNPVIIPRSPLPSDVRRMSLRDVDGNERRVAHSTPYAHSKKQPSQAGNGSNSGPRGQRSYRGIPDGQGRASAQR